jgi:hypothetical protein
MFKSFFQCYFAVSETLGFAWWNSEGEYLKAPGRPADSIPFSETSTNSRGSKFLKAAVCWPLILVEDCPKATDPQRTYFGIEYYDVRGDKNEMLVLAAATPEERDEWVFHITKFVKLFLANRSESEAFLQMKVGSDSPPYVSKVLDGEAPGSAMKPKK